MKNLNEFIDQIIPSAPSVEIPRGPFIRQSIKGGFSTENDKVRIVGDLKSGKTNLLSQFVRQNRDQCIAYFITNDPSTQRGYAFLYTLCCQVNLLLGKSMPQEGIALNKLEALLNSASIKLAQQARKRKIAYYFVIDGIENGLQGPTGERIIDKLSLLTTAPHSPYLLFSCRSDQVSKLPEYLDCLTKHPPEFSRLEIETYLEDGKFSQQEIVIIHENYRPLPGYLKILKESKQTNPDFDLETAPLELDELIQEQVELIIRSSSELVVNALEVLAASPTSLPIKVLAELSDTSKNLLIRHLEQLSIVEWDQYTQRVEYVDDIARSCVRERSGEKRVQDIVKDLRKRIQADYPNEDLLLTLLLEQIQDYEGLQDTLAHREIIETVDNTQDMISVMRRLHLASEMALERGITEDLVKWTLGITVTRSFIEHAASSQEIEALLAVGDSQNALSRAYLVPEISSKVRLLAKSYAGIKDRGGRVRKEALDELSTMVQSMDLHTMDKETIFEIAIDLFPILPETAFSILEKTMGYSQKRSVIEIAIEAIERELEKTQQNSVPANLKNEVNLGYIAQILSSWLNDIPLSKLSEELRAVENTEAREYIIRQWCRQNRENSETPKAIDMWLHTVIDDRDFVIPLRSLRHISEVVVHAPLAERRRLIARLRGPEINALDSPQEEWVRFHLGVAEGIFEIDKEEAITEIKGVHQRICESVVDSDVKAFCLSRLWVTVQKLCPDEFEWISNIHTQFSETFYPMLENTAEQYEAAIETILTLVEVDPTNALTLALELNTYSRRSKAVREVLAIALRKRGEENLTAFLKDALDVLEKIFRDSALVRVASELDAREIVIDPQNTEILLEYAREISDYTLKSRALSHLSSLLSIASSDKAIPVMEEAIESWRKEEDLKVLLVYGFKLVKSLAKIDIEGAKSLCEEVQNLKFQPGSILAMGELGTIFNEILELAIRAVTRDDLDEEKQGIEHLKEFIRRIPSRTIRMRLFAMLAASAYRVDRKEYADELVRTQVIQEIERMKPDPSRGEREFQHDYSKSLIFCLPVIFEYDFSSAKELAGILQFPARDLAWHSSVFWTLSRSFLGDHLVGTDKLRVARDNPKLRKALQAAAEIRHDVLLYQAIHAIANVVGVSMGKLDLTQALDVLHRLDELAMALPDKSQENIEHKGYSVLSQAIIHGVRSRIFHSRYYRSSRAGSCTKNFMRKQWQKIDQEAKAIPNVADRVFVMALIAPETAKYYTDHKSAKDILNEAESEIDKIPSLLDRVDRLQTIADSWNILKERSKAKVIFDHIFELISRLEGSSADNRLKLLVQAAYKVDPGFADDLTSRLDNRLPHQIVHPAKLTIEVEKLRHRPPGICNLQSKQIAPTGVVMRQAARKLLEDFASGKGVCQSAAVLNDWLINARLYRSRTSIDILHWVVEDIHRTTFHVSGQSRLSIFLQNARLSHELAMWISNEKDEGIPEQIQDSFPGLSTKFVIFRRGQTEKAKQWLQRWLRENVKHYIKICDPYFGIEQFEYFKYIPMDCKVLVITTDQKIGSGRVKIERKVERYWGNLTNSALPEIQLIIIPKKLEEKFHDRLIISSDSGLDIGPSLNGLGTSFQKITILSEEDAAEQERNYLSRMLDSGTWFMKDVRPEILFLGGE